MSRRKTIQSYRDLEVWQRGIDLTEQVYRMTRALPPEEKYGLTAQIRRAALSVPSNIAEGWGRGRKEYAHFAKIARCSVHEVETQIMVACRLGYISEETQDALLAETETESKMLLSLIRSLQRK